MKKQNGISLISLIITIIVIIILAAIVIFTGLNTPDRANFAKFVHEFSDFHTATIHDFSDRKMKYSLSNQSKSDKAIYYEMATGSVWIDLNEIPYYSGEVATLNGSIANGGLGKIYPEGLEGEHYYEITDDKNIKEWKSNKGYGEVRKTGSSTGEHHYITDKGEPFILPGYRVDDAGETR